MKWSLIITALLLSVPFVPLTADSSTGWEAQGADLSRSNITYAHASLSFDGDNAYDHVVTQVGHGPRHVGSVGWNLTSHFMSDTMEQLGYDIEWEYFDGWRGELDGVEMHNIIARKPGPAPDSPIIMLGGHFDTRSVAEHDPDHELRDEPIIGANDGASEIGALLELGRVFANSELDHELWFYFIDGEDYGDASGGSNHVNSMFYGSEYTAGNLSLEIVNRTSAFILLDMIGDEVLQIKRETAYSDPELTDRIWENASELGYGDYFVDQGTAVWDDHRYFHERGIPAIDIIDFRYGPNNNSNAYWHTHDDSLDKISAHSLEAVGRTVERYVQLEGNWTPTIEPPVEDGMVIENDTVIVDRIIPLNGSVIIDATLLMDNVTFEVNNTQGDRGIFVGPNGSLIASNFTLVCNVPCSFEVFGQLQLDGCTLDTLGVADARPAGHDDLERQVGLRSMGYEISGVMISGAATLTNCSITSIGSAIAVLEGALTATNLTVNAPVGLVEGGSNLGLEQVTFNSTDIGVYGSRGELHLSETTVSNLEHGIIMDNGTLDTNDVEFSGITEWNLDLRGSNHMTSDDVHQGQDQIRRQWFLTVHASSMSCDSPYAISVSDVNEVLVEGAPGNEPVTLWFVEHEETAAGNESFMPLEIKLECGELGETRMIEEVTSNPTIVFLQPRSEEEAFSWLWLVWAVPFTLIAMGLLGLLWVLQKSIEAAEREEE